jgi:hypothetical protein
MKNRFKFEVYFMLFVFLGLPVLLLVRALLLDQFGFLPHLGH